MQTLRLNAADPSAIQRAAEIVCAGGLVGFPTETVYGLGANALDAAAVRKIFAAKERPAWDPVIVHLASWEMLGQVAEQLPREFNALYVRFMPGPLTVLLEKSSEVPSEVTAGRVLVGVRFPAHPVAKKLIAAAGVPIVAPSANRFGKTSPTTAEHVLADLDGRIDAVLDGGPTQVGVESTVLDLSTTPPRILRQGGVTREQLEEVLGRVEVYKPAISEAAPPESLPSPGVGIRHYAPKAKLILVSGDEGSLRAEAAKHKNGGLLLPRGWSASGKAFDWGSWGNWQELASRLFAGMRWLDEQGVNVIVAPRPLDEGIGSAIIERLEKASKD
jgi:L-threonylcarbamoyladenylate synthase